MGITPIPPFAPRPLSRLMFASPPATTTALRLDDHRFWAVARASLDHVRDTVEITRGDHELLDALILTAALDANMAPVKRAPDLRQAYGGPSVSAPDDLRRPVSVNAVAQSLNLPFETVRRRARRLAKAGLCVIGPQGMVAPHSLTTSPSYVADQRARYDRARLFYETLKALGALPAFEPAPPSAPPGTEPPVRAANWALSEYTLRACADLIALTGDVVSSRVLMELALIATRPAANGKETGPITADLDPAGGLARLGRPTRVAALAASLNLPRETVRRRVAELETLGFCRREADGVVAALPAAMAPRVVEMARTNAGNVQRLFGSLARAGVLADWEG